MSSREHESGNSPPMEPLLDALGTEMNREILSALDEPMTAAELVEQCDIPTSTMYRKLDVLSEVGLVKEHLAVDSRSGRCSLYERNVERISVSVSGDGGLTVRVEGANGSLDAEKTWGAVEN